MSSISQVVFVLSSSLSILVCTFNKSLKGISLILYKGKMQCAGHMACLSYIIWAYGLSLVVLRIEGVHNAGRIAKT